MQYNLLFATDTHYAPYLLVACQSVLDHIDPPKNELNNAKDQLVFNVIVDDGVNLADTQHLADEFSQRNTNVPVDFCFKFHKIDASCFDDFSPMIRDKNKSKGAYYRIMADKFIDPAVERVLYLDIDVLVQVDIREIFEQYPLKDKLIGAVCDLGMAPLAHKDQTTGQYVLKTATSRTDPSKHIFLPLSGYFNSGIMLINISEWRNQRISEKALELGTQWDWTFHDQDILNYLCANQVERLDLSWNFTSTLFYLAYNPETELYDKFSTILDSYKLPINAPRATEFYNIKHNLKIVHLTYGKPWQAFSYGVTINKHTVNICPELAHYINLWRQTASKLDFLLLTEKLQNLDSISFTTAFINTELNKRIAKLFRRYRLYRKIMGAALLFLLILNLITLGLILSD